MYHWVSLLVWPAVALVGIRYAHRAVESVCIAVMGKSSIGASLLAQFSEPQPGASD